MQVDFEREMRVLVVDDVQVHRFLMTSGLERVNPFMEIDEASSLEEAIAKLGANRYHAVVSDWNMAGGGGDQLVKWMRARPNFKRVPFIMISGNNDSESIISAFMALGVDAYVVKPFTPLGLYQKIIAALEARSG